MRVGVFPVRNHYYEPQFDMRGLRTLLSDDRTLPGIDWNVGEQLELLGRFTFGAELTNLPPAPTGRREFTFGNGAFESGDAEYLYQMIRLMRPKRFFEVGSGNSTLMALRALRKTKEEDASYQCEHLCIEPYEVPWLETMGVSVIRKRVEEIELSLFKELDRNDILFIDSSHVIRPQGDVLFEILELLPNLKGGVIVHIHDIFSPRNYLKDWIVDEVRLWNEQYLVEAFLSNNAQWKIIGALNYLYHHHYDRLKLVTPYLGSDREPGSLYIQKVRC